MLLVFIVIYKLVFSKTMTKSAFRWYKQNLWFWRHQTALQLFIRFSVQSNAL